jgi:hypothetical protein
MMGSQVRVLQAAPFQIFSLFGSCSPNAMLLSNCATGKGIALAFEKTVRDSVDEYVRKHIAGEAWHAAYFDFINDRELASRLSDEFLSTRYIYKLLEGLEADGWLLRAQIRLQVLSYASIYEAVLHHLLFSTLRSDERVISLTEFPMKKVISIPAQNLAALKMHLSHDGKEIIPTYIGVGKTDDTKVRFDRKAECACEIGIIDEWLRDELIEFYEARNSIHIHAEIRKSLNYVLDLSRRSYLRLQPFRDQIIQWQNAKKSDEKLSV